MTVNTTWTRYICEACGADEILATPGHLRAIDDNLWAETIVRKVAAHHAQLDNDCALSTTEGGIRIITDGDEMMLRAMTPEAFHFKWEQTRRMAQRTTDDENLD